MIKCIILDDEKPAVDEMAYLLSTHESVTVVGAYTDPMELVTKLHAFPDHVLFLDINMPKISGLIIADHILKQNLPIRIVFVTAYDDYAIKAFELNAVDYLLKPVSAERLAMTLHKLSEQTQHEPSGIKTLVKDYKQKNQVLSLYRDGVLKPIKYDEISVIYHEDRTTHFVTGEGTFTCKKNLSEIEDILSDAFFRCHRGFIINLDAVRAIEPWFNNTYMVSMNHYKDQVPISRSNVATFKAKMHIL